MWSIHTEPAENPGIVAFRLKDKSVQSWADQLIKTWMRLLERLGANEAQIGVQGCYEFFPSKQALFEELFISRGQEFQASARTIAEAGLPPEDEIRHLTFALVRHFHDHPSALPVFVRSRSVADWGMESRLSATLGIYEAGRVQLQRCIAELADAGVLRPLPLEFMTELYLDVLQACLQFNFRHCNNEEVHVCVGRALECFLHGTRERP